MRSLVCLNWCLLGKRNVCHLSRQKVLWKFIRFVFWIVELHCVINRNSLWLSFPFLTFHAMGSELVSPIFSSAWFSGSQAIWIIKKFNQMSSWNETVSRNDKQTTSCMLNSFICFSKTFYRHDKFAQVCKRPGNVSALSSWQKCKSFLICNERTKIQILFGLTYACWFYHIHLDTL